MEAIDSNAVVYPDSDGERMAENTLQFEWIVMLKENLDAVLPGFVAGDLLWYPVEGDNRCRRAPDVLVALDRPKGYRGSYRQWEEDGHPPDVVIEVLSPGNRALEMLEKLEFYREHGAKEFYVIDPDAQKVLVWVDSGQGLSAVKPGESFQSPRLGVTFFVNGTVRVEHTDGTPFKTFQQLQTERNEAVAAYEAMAAERDAVSTQRDEVAAERDALLATLRRHGIDPDA